MFKVSSERAREVKSTPGGRVWDHPQSMRRAVKEEAVDKHLIHNENKSTVTAAHDSMKNNGERLTIRASFCLLSNFYNFFLPALPTFPFPIHSTTRCNQDMPYLSTTTALAKTNSDHIFANPNSMLSSHVAQCVEGDATNSALWGSSRC